jgi:hypothetical protein
MNTKMKIATSLILTGSLVLTPISGVIQQSNNNNIVQAKEQNITQKDREIGNIIKDYITLEKKENKFKFNFKYDVSLDNRLKKIKANITSADVSALVANLNAQLENNNSELSVLIKNMDISRHYGFRSKCSDYMGWAGVGVGGAYGALGLVLGATGPAGWALYGTGLVLSGFMNYAASRC